MMPLYVRFTGDRNHAYVSGNGARSALVGLLGRTPPWSRKNRAYVVLEATAVDVIAAAEMRGWRVVVTGARWVPPRPLADPSPAVVETEAGLW